MLFEAAYSYRISESKDQGNDSRINHELKLLINNHKNYVHLEHYTQTHPKKKKGLVKCGREREGEGDRR